MYIVKLGFTGVYIIYCFHYVFIEAFLTFNHNLHVCYEQKLENYQKVSTEICHFAALKIAAYCIGMFA